MKKLRPLAWLIIILNVALLYRLFSQLQTDDDQYYQAGAVLGYMFLAGFVNIILYIFLELLKKEINKRGDQWLLAIRTV